MKAKQNEQAVSIKAPDFKVAVFRIVGDAPYIQNKFSQKARQTMRDAQEAGQAGKKGKKREPKDFKACYEAAIHRTADGWYGIPAAAFRKAMVSACRIVGFKMTHAKLALRALADGFDRDDGVGLVRILKGKPEYFEAAVRNESGVCDIRARPMWREGWEAEVRIRFDTDLFTLADISALLLRAGQQVGIGEGRPDSPNSCGMDWGTFDIRSRKETSDDA